LLVDDRNTKHRIILQKKTQKESKDCISDKYFQKKDIKPYIAYAIDSVKL